MSASLKVAGQNKDSVAVVFGQILNHIERSSLYRNTVDWGEVRAKGIELAKPAQSIPELRKAIGYVLEAIGDEHARVFYNNQLLANYYGAMKEHQKAFNPEIFNNVQLGKVYAFEAKLLAKGIGYVRIVGLPMGDNQQMAAVIEEAICQIALQDVDQWVIDLRYNGGGNLNPMAEGLAQLIGDGSVGGTAGLTNAESSTWKILDGHFYYDDYSVLLAHKCRIKAATKVAVLTSLYTASSGEALAVMLKGRKNTRFFGENTLGLITSTDWNVINSKTAMTIATSYYKDSNGKVYKQYVDVDETMPFVSVPLSATDTTVKRATEWLSGR